MFDLNGNHYVMTPTGGPHICPDHLIQSADPPPSTSKPAIVTTPVTATAPAPAPASATAAAVLHGTFIELLIQYKGRTLHGDYRVKTTIQEVKEEILDREDIPVENQILLYKGQRLDDSKIVADLPSGSSLQLVTRSRIELQIMYQGKTFVIDLMIIDTLQQLKEIISDKIDIAIDRLRLVFAGKELIGDTNQLVDCGIVGNTTLYLVVKPLPCFQERAEYNRTRQMDSLLASGSTHPLQLQSIRNEQRKTQAAYLSCKFKYPSGKTARRATRSATRRRRRVTRR